MHVWWFTVIGGPGRITSQTKLWWWQKSNIFSVSQEPRPLTCRLPEQEPKCFFNMFISKQSWAFFKAGFGRRNFFCGIVILAFFFSCNTVTFGQPSAGGGRRGFLFTLPHPDSSQTLSFTPRGERDRTLSVGFTSNWHRHRPPTKPDNNAPSTATKLANTTFARANGRFKL